MPPMISSTKRAFGKSGGGLYRPWATSANAMAEATKTVANPIIWLYPAENWVQFCPR